MKKVFVGMKITVMVGLIGAISTAQAEDSDSGQKGPRGFVHRGGPGGHHRMGPGGHGGPGMLVGKEGMKACAEAAGVTFAEGKRPEISEDQKSSIKSCLEGKEAAVKACLSSAGVSLPEPPKNGERPAFGQKPPKLDDAAKAAIDSCRQQALSGSSDSTATSSGTTSSSAL